MLKIVVTYAILVSYNGQEKMIEGTSTFDPRNGVCEEVLKEDTENFVYKTSLLIRQDLGDVGKLEKFNFSSVCL